MTGVALLLVLASAVCHATWNFLLKRSDHKLAFLGSAGVVASTTLLIPAIAVGLSNGVGVEAAALGCVTACLHGAYGLSLSRGYRLGDLSSIYPISRGFGLALVPVAAVLLLDETISPIAILGIAMIAVGVYSLHIEPHALRDVSAPLRALTGSAGRAALFTGVLIAAYSIWDKHALDELSPVVLNQFAMTGHAIITTTVALTINTDDIRWEWRSHAPSIVAAGVLIPVAYLLVLAALETSEVAYVAPSREVGIVFGAALGVLFLGEGFGLWRIWAALAVVAGVVILALAP
jgi:drug/metabolite transporter (DMT)-like permease